MSSSSQLSTSSLLELLAASVDFGLVPKENGKEVSYHSKGLKQGSKLPLVCVIKDGDIVVTLVGHCDDEI